MKVTAFTFFLAVLFILLCFPLHSQSDLIIDHLLEEKNAGFGNAVYIVLTAVEEIPTDTSLQNAVLHLADKNWKLKQRDIDEPIRVGEFSLIVLKAFSIKGGIFFRIFPTPRYAAREFVYLDLIPYDRNPYGYISGEEVLYIVGKMLDMTGKRL